MTLPVQFGTITPAPNRISYSAYPAGNPPQPAWSAIPNFLNETAAFSVNIVTTYLNPPTGTAVLQGSLPSGFSYVAPTFSYDGVGIGGPTAFDWLGQASGFSAPSNTVTASGAGGPITDPNPPTVPLGAATTAVSSSSVSFSGYPSSDPNPPGFHWDGLGNYFVKRIQGGSTVTTSFAAPGLGNKPVFTVADIGTPSNPTTMVQTGANFAFVTQAVDPSFPTQDGMGTGYMQITGTQWVFTCKISNFVAADEFSNIGLMFRQSLATNSAYIATITTPFAQGFGVLSQFRASAGGSVTTLQHVANSASPIWLAVIRNGDTYTFGYSLDGNNFTSLGSQTQVMGATLYAAMLGNTSSGVAISYTLQNVNLQNQANWTFTDATVSPGTYTYQFAVDDAASPTPNLSAYGNPVTVVVPSSGGGGGSSPANDLFPRPYLLAQGGFPSYGTTLFQTMAGKFPFVGYDGYLGIEQDNGYTYAGVMATVAENAAANGIPSRQVMYWLNQAAGYTPGNGGARSTFTYWINKVNTWNWRLLTPSWPGGSPVPDSNPGTSGNSSTLCNSIKNVALDTSTGLNFFQTLAKYITNIYTLGNAVSMFGEAKGFAPNPTIGGFFLDNQFWEPLKAGAWAQNSVNYDPSTQTSTLYPWQQQGHAAQIAAIRALWPNVVIVGNINFFDNNPGDFLDPASLGLYTGGFCEEAIGQSYSKETFAGWLGMMASLIKSEPMAATGGVLILHQDGGHGGRAWSASSQSSWLPIDWQYARYGLASALLRGYYHALTDPTYTAANVHYMDEYDQGSLTWMGTAIDAPIDPTTQAPWSGTVYRRRFTGGWLLINPDTGSSSPVALGTTMHRCNSIGYGDPAVNSGAAITSWTPNGGADAIFLRP